MLGIFGLDQNFAATALAASAAGHLHDRLCESLGGAKVGAEQTLIGIQHHHQRQAREMMALGHHLRAHQDARFAREHAAA